jgi:putative SOS response-associated peptidase YedK
MQLTSGAENSEMGKSPIIDVSASPADLETSTNMRWDRRCLIPADGFYKWKLGRNPPQPWRFIRKHEELFGFAGLWSSGSTDNGLRTVLILTVPANKLVAQFDAQMPVMLDENGVDAWFAKDATYVQLRELLQPYPREMSAYPVHPRISDTNIDDAACIEKWDDARLG